MEHESFVTYQQAIALKSGGFDWECKFYYDNGDAPYDEVWFTNLNAEINHNGSNNPRICSAPTLAMAARWLREVKGIDIIIYLFREIDARIEPHEISRKYQVGICIGEDGDCTAEYFSTYESALSVGIDKTLKLINN